MNNGHELASPRYKQAYNYGQTKSQALKQLQILECMSPLNSRCKLFEFTSEKKQRNQFAPSNHSIVDNRMLMDYSIGYLHVLLVYLVLLSPFSVNRQLEVIP